MKINDVEYNCDLLMQYEWPKHSFNTGFWIARKSARVERMLEDMTADTKWGAGDDQGYFNEYLLKQNTLLLIAPSNANNSRAQDQLANDENFGRIETDEKIPAPDHIKPA
jgi:hypothetical protein